MIEGNKILLDDSFSWNQVYDLWTKQHDMNGRRDKMAQSVLRPMVENHDEKIVGIHSSASFEVAFPMLYDIIEYYANGKTQKEEKNKKWCSLYLPKLKSFISEYFPDK